MRFHIDKDTGSLITGWIVPDNPNATPRIRIFSSGSQPVELVANHLRSGVKSRQWHSTGHVGFRIDKKAVPQLGTAPIEIYDVETGLLIYRRPQPQHIQAKVLYYSMHLMPQRPLQEAMAQHFTLNYSAVESLSDDQLFGILNNRFCESVLISGRMTLKKAEHLFRDVGFQFLTTLRDPHEELAERLLFLRYAANRDRDSDIDKYLTGCAPLVDAVRNLALSEDEALRAFFVSLNDEQRFLFSNPYVRLLACEPGEQPEKRHIGLALEGLSRFDAVGVAFRFDSFRAIVQELLQVDILQSYRPADISWTPIIASKLAQIPEAVSLLTFDHELYRHVTEAIDAAIVD